MSKLKILGGSFVLLWNFGRLALICLYFYSVYVMFAGGSILGIDVDGGLYHGITWLFIGSLLYSWSEIALKWSMMKIYYPLYLWATK